MLARRHRVAPVPKVIDASQPNGPGLFDRIAPCENVAPITFTTPETLAPVQGQIDRSVSSFIDLYQ